MISEDATFFDTAENCTAKTNQKYYAENGVNGSDILLPDHIIMTAEILRNNICRICATYHESGPMLVSLYHCDTEAEPLAKTVNDLLPIKVHEGDGLPGVACAACARQLRAWRRLRARCEPMQAVLASQAELLSALDETPPQAAADEKLLLTDVIQNILASYVDNISLMELACQVCRSKYSSEEFPRHLRVNHKDLRSRDDVEVFVRDHVTFEESLESDGDCESVGSGVESSGFHRDIDNVDPPPHLKMCSRDSNETGELEKASKLACGGDIAVANGTPRAVAEETNQKRIPAVCPECNRTFSNKYNMLSHLRAHGARPRVHCECGRSYSTRGNLAAHRRAAHAPTRPHACEHCPARFASAAARDVHARLHSGARPHACARCPRAFRARATLLRHLDTHAPRRFPCALCGRAFRRRQHLRHHVATHRRPPEPP